ncbi:M28 family peptidase [Pelagicoccus sp. SDUM812005]|uniref:M28 family peptidase n=1 Tax=Pelagicoccus sp. SDUM812005 TaxID=3041257 RepID=UPI00280C7FF4|nr:M28 family peptidase [Pelagicoccus sp. SDUM812005]MDQ8183660.1 M28 family peptidase [Pelagicoccus sp. SDUM812005]
MKKLALLPFAALLGVATLSNASDELARERLLGSAFLDNQSYHLLEEMTNLYGGRITGSESNEKSMQMLEQALDAHGIANHREAFTFPGWERREDRATLLHPLKRELRSIAMGYVDQHASFAAELIYLGKGSEQEIPANSQGKIGLLAANVKLSQDSIQSLATENGIVGLLLTNRKNGGQLLARTANYSGDASPIPIYSVTEEEGHWLKRLVESGEKPRVQLATTSIVKEIESYNLVATLPGKTSKKIVIGAHFDSWDLGQGALDNGLGIAQAYDITRLIHKINPENHFTIETVWFNAEEFGLFGSYAYMEQHQDDEIVAMINMDMVGNPLGANAMGFVSLMPVLKEFSQGMGGLSLPKPVVNAPWLGSDHMPFIVQGIPSITLNAPIDPDAVAFYHDFGDTFEKVDEEVLAKSIGILSLLTFQLANDPSLDGLRLNREKTIELLQNARLELRMKRYNIWPFEDEPKAP